MRDPICGMDVKPADAFTLTFGGETYYFCSRRCVERFVEENHAHAAKITNPPSRSSKPSIFRRLLRNKTVLVFLIAGALIAFSYVQSALVPFRHTFLMFARDMGWAIGLGFLLGGVIDYAVPHIYISAVLTARRKRSILYAVIAGFLMSACSHGILALSIQLHKKGASNASVVAFLLASPWANLPFAVILIGFFGVKAFFLIFAALVIAVTTGLAFHILEKKKWIETNPNVREHAKDFSVLRDLRGRLKEYRFSLARLGADIRGIAGGAYALADMVLWWLILGFILAGLAASFVPQDWFLRYMGPTTSGLLVTLAFATVLEVCSEGMAPLALEIFKQTGSFGNVLVFLMAGVATDYTEIGLLWTNVGKRTAIWLPVIAVPQIILFGLLANRLF